MTIRLFLSLFLALLIGKMESMAQGTFQNPDFESPITPLVPVAPGSSAVPASNAVPGWTVYLGTDQQSLVLYNDFYLGTAVVALEGPGNPYGPALQGNYSVLLQAGAYLQSGNYVAASISQSSLVPDSAESLRFRVQGSDFSLAFNGQVLPLVNLGSGPGYDLYGADVSALEGQSGNFQFSALSLPSNRFNWVYLDDITFSDQPIPEPGMFGLFALGALLFAWRLGQKKQ